MSETADPHAALFAAAPPPVRERLEAIRALAVQLVPDARPCVSYRMPAMRIGAGKGRVFCYFAGFSHHIGIYPPVSGPPELIAALKPHANAKGNLAFRHDSDLPLELIGQVITALAQQYRAP